MLNKGTRTGRTAIQVAKRRTTGELVGIDIWDIMELSGNSPERAYKKAEIEDVKEKVEFKFGARAGFSKVRFYDEKGIGIFIFEK